MRRYNTKEQQKIIDDTREEIQQRTRDRIKREEKEEKVMNYKLVCNKCNQEHSITLSNLTSYQKILNVKTGISLKEKQTPGTYRIMEISSLPCNCRDSHWVYVTD